VGAGGAIGAAPAEGTVVAIGAAAVVQGFALAGVRLLKANDESAVRAAWAESVSSTEVQLIVLSPYAAQVLGAAIADVSTPLTVVMPG
jgi:vacuolar-type H+-ATPase subunit F/Vma7